MPINEIIYSVAKNGEKTCSCNGKFLHSKYNPSAEAQKFVENIQADFNPLCVFIIEPALSYCFDFLKKRFPNATFCAIRFSSQFSSTDKLWDKVFYFSDNLSNEIFDFLGEEKICSSIFSDWTASKNIFPELTEKTWFSIKDVVLKSRSIINTRAYFAKRWLKNTILFTKNIEKTFTIEKSNFPIVIVASGTSLESSIDFLKKYREKYFLIAVSSAFSVLQYYKIQPDFVISTDGGYWAKKHLEFSNENQAFALSIEAAVPKKLFTNNSIIPLLYDDCIPFEKSLMEKLGISYMLARRNGTVSGTALEFAMSITSNSIFLCGLDQAPAIGYQHTQPNALESNSAQFDNKLNTKETRLTSSRFNSQVSLKIYRDWFISNSTNFNMPYKRIFRLSNNFKFDFDLGKIEDINWEDFEKFINEMKLPVKNKICKNQIKLKKELRKTLILESLKQAIADEKFVNEYFPMDYLMIKREKSEEKKNEIKNSLKEKQQKLIEEIKKII